MFFENFGYGRIGLVVGGDEVVFEISFLGARVWVVSRG